VLFVLDTEGTFTNLGNNTNVGGGWEKVVYHPVTFYATITKGGNGQETYFSEPLIGPCLLMSDYLANEHYGCPCNGTWTSAAITSGTTSSATRVINATTCPMVNLTNGTRGSSCPENYFFRRADRYGSIRVTNVTNGTNGTRLLEITQPLLDNTSGWNNTLVYQSYTADFSCPSTINQNTTNPGKSTATRLELFVVPYFLALVGGLAFVVH
jgi:hypothetical protein